jgi:nicotinate phosphoribosyltransferase
LEGVKNAIEAGKWLKDHGHRFSGIRLDSGDLNFLSIEARKLLDAAGFHDTFIVGSNDLNEHLIEDLKRQGSKITVWGVGTQLVTAFDQPTLGGVYKLAAVRGKDGKWKRKIKLSEQTVKTTIPGPQQVRRFKDQSQMICDMIYDTENPPSQGIQVIIDPTDPTHRRKIPSSTPYEDLLIPVIRNGKRVYSSPTINEIRERALKERNEIHAAIRRFVNPHIYPVGLEKSLYERRARMILETKGFKDSPIV